MITLPLQIRPNRLKDKLKKGEPAYQMAVLIPQPTIVEMIGEAGYDSINLDIEHSSFGLETFENMIIAGDEYGLTSVVRVADNDRAEITRVLDSGAQGV